MSPDLLIIGGAFLTGLTGSGHCAAMCGGIATGFSARINNGGWIDALEPNVGRIMAYTLAGSIAGGVGHGIVAAAQSAALTWTLRAAVGIVLIIAALRLMAPARFAFLSLPGRGLRWIQPLQRRVLPADTTGRRMLAGALWGFLPCGLSTTLLVAAWLQGHALQGAMTMLAFGLGTVPVMVPLTWSGARLGQRLQRPAWRLTAGMIVLSAGALTLTAPLLMRVPALHGVLAALGCASALQG